MTKKERCEIAIRAHEEGLNCAQCVLLAYQDMTGMTREQCWGIGTGFGGGVRYGGICGAISGAVMVLGMLYPHTPENGAAGKKASTVRTREFISRFQQRFVHTECRELLQDQDLNATDLTRELGVTGHCGILIVSAVDMLFDYLEELERE